MGNFINTFTGQGSAVKVIDEFRCAPRGGLFKFEKYDFSHSSDETSLEILYVKFSLCLLNSFLRHTH